MIARLKAMSDAPHKQDNFFFPRLGQLNDQVAFLMPMEFLPKNQGLLKKQPKDLDNLLQKGSNDSG